MGFLYRFETKGIQNWILASDRLRELKGGSALVNQLSVRALEQALRCGAEPQSFSAAGGGTFLFPSEQALAAFAAWFPLFAERFATGLPVVQAWAPADEGLGAVMRALRRQTPALERSLPEPGPLVLRAARTGLPSVGRNRNAHTDAATAQKLIAADIGGAELGDAANFEFEDNLERYPDAYVAVIHADGNGVGQRFIDLQGDGDKAAELSRKLAEIATRCVIDALEVVVGMWPRGHNSALPLRPVVVGGDDMTMIVTASLALPFVDAYLRAFERHTQAGLTSLGGGMTAKAGVAFVKKHWPFAQAHVLAESLATAAKAADKSQVAFYRVTTSLVDDWREIRESALGCADDSVLSMAPYDLDALGKLERLAATLDRRDGQAGMPRGPLRQWVSLAKADPVKAGRAWERMEHVLSSDRTRHKAWDDFVAALDAFGDTGARTHGFVGDATPVLDALEWRTLQPRAGARLNREADV